jgi:LTXXQ motif family protein
MEKRLNATLGAVKTVQPALAKFYKSLSDEQKARSNSLRSASPLAVADRFFRCLWADTVSRGTKNLGAVPAGTHFGFRPRSAPRRFLSAPASAPSTALSWSRSTGPPVGLVMCAMFWQ